MIYCAQHITLYIYHRITDRYRKQYEGVITFLEGF